MSVLSEEIWKPIPGWGGRYEASSLGRVRSVGIGGNGKQGQLLKASPMHGRRRYLRVTLTHNRVKKLQFVHVLVMLAFEGPPTLGHEVDHLDNDPLNAKWSNLEYVTRSEQQRRAYRRDRTRTPSSGAGELNHCAKLTWAQVREIRRKLQAKEISGRALAREMGVSQGAITAIATGKTWIEPCRS
jgi:hypothetical protein